MQRSELERNYIQQIKEGCIIGVKWNKKNLTEDKSGKSHRYSILLRLS